KIVFKGKPGRVDLLAPGRVRLQSETEPGLVLAGVIEVDGSLGWRVLGGEVSGWGPGRALQGPHRPAAGRRQTPAGAHSPEIRALRQIRPDHHGAAAWGSRPSGRAA